MQFYLTILGLLLAAGIVQATIDPIILKNKRTNIFRKRDYATTVQFLKAAVENYKKDHPGATLPSLPSTLPSTPPPMLPATLPTLSSVPFSLPPPPPPLALVPQPQPYIDPPMDQSMPYYDPPMYEDDLGEFPPMDIDPYPIYPQFGYAVKADIEEDDKFDPEEDPDDVGTPPTINGVPSNREE